MKKNLFEKAVREGKIRQNEEGVWEIWHYLTVKSKQFDSAKKCDENGGYWENTHKTYKHKSKEKMLQWYNRSFCNDSDSPRYKAIGNSIALPFWYWLLYRISNLYDRTPTLGSLFDGIGGFPLCWESINGSNTARWASEIELFPIAVTRTRFSKD
jgi:site-specific DNA-cytosine methylase